MSTLSIAEANNPINTPKRMSSTELKIQFWKLGSVEYIFFAITPMPTDPEW